MFRLRKKKIKNININHLYPNLIAMIFKFSCRKRVFICLGAFLVSMGLLLELRVFFLWGVMDFYINGGSSLFLLSTLTFSCLGVNVHGL